MVVFRTVRKYRDEDPIDENGQTDKQTEVQSTV